MAYQHPSVIETSISRLSQAAYGTARASGDDYVRIINSSKEVANNNPSTLNDAAYDQGSDLPFTVWLDKWASEMALSPDFNFQDIGYLLLDALGGYTAGGQIDGGLYRHTFFAQDAAVSRQLPARTMMKDLGSLGLYVYRDMVSGELTISGSKDGRLQTAANYRGSGYEAVNPAGYTSPAIAGNREYAYANQINGGIELSNGGTRQVETAVAAGTATTPGNATLTVTGAHIAGSPLAIPVTLAGSETASQQAALFRKALRETKAVNKEYAVSGAAANIVLTDRKYRANDATLNVEIGAGTTGITAAASSTDTTAGVAATTDQHYSCALSTFAINIRNPQEGDGYLQCSENMIADDPESGLLKAEDLFGVREYTVDYSVKLDVNDPARQMMKERTLVRVRIPVFGVEANGYSLIMTHDRGQIISATKSANVDGFIGYSGQIQLLSNSGVIGLQFELINNIPSYAS